MRLSAGKYKGRNIKTDSLKGYRPVSGKVRESLFSMLSSCGLDWHTASVLDIFSGSGSLAFEALSRGAKSAVCVEKSASACRILRENIRILAAENCCKVVQKDAHSFLAKLIFPFSLVFADPPYGKDLAKPTLELLDRGNLVEAGGFLCVETEATLELSTIFAPERFVLQKDRLFGQTRIYIWQKLATK